MLAGLTDDEKSYLRRIERKLDQDQKYKECMRNLDPIFRKQNRALVDVSALKRFHSRYSCCYSLSAFHFPFKVNSTSLDITYCYAVLPS